MLFIFKYLFYLSLTCVTCVASFSKSNFKFTRNVSVNTEQFTNSSINIFFECPNIKSNEDNVWFYKLFFPTKTLIAKTKNNTILIKLRSKSDLGSYQCSVIYSDKTSQNATLNIMDASKIESPKKFIYNISQNKYVFNESGSAELNCDGKIKEKVSWYRPPQFHIFVGNILKIKKLTKFDYGTYYCVIGETTKTILTVTKFILISNKSEIKEKSIDKNVKYFENVISKDNEITYIPKEVRNKSDVVTWEQPLETILLDQGRHFYIQSYNAGHTKSSFYYRINRYGDFSIDNVGKMNILDSKDKEMNSSVEGSTSSSTTVTLQSSPTTYLLNGLPRVNERVISNKELLNNSIFEENTASSAEVQEIKIKTIMKNLNSSKKEIKYLKEELKNIKNNMEVLKEALKKYQNETSLKLLTMKEESERNKKEMMEQKKKLALLKEVNKSRRRCQEIKTIEQWIKWNKVCPNIEVDFIWKVDKISQKVDQHILSEPFYSHDYKLRLWVYFYLNEEISIGCMIMKGDNDDTVEWPMQLAVTLSPIDLLSLKPYNNESFRYDTYHDINAFIRSNGEYVNDNFMKKYFFVSSASKKHRSSVIVNDSIVISCTLSFF